MAIDRESGKLLVVHPAFGGERVGLDFALGVQRLVARRLKACGRPTCFALARATVDEVDLAGAADASWKVGDKIAATIEAWPDEALTAMIVEQFECRWAVVPEFHADPDGCRLSTRLLEVDEQGTPQLVERWSFAGENPALPEHLVQLLRGLGEHTGTRVQWTDIVGLFGIDHPIPALYYLRALGYCSQLEDDCRVDRRQVLATLCVALEGAPAMEPLVDLVPEIVYALARAGTTDVELAQWLRELRQRAGSEAWPGLLEAARAARDGVD
ncbi:MAG TPA: hypothetical protein VFG69_09000 [Nannocystaceae bacterium]|nr:hypothetical protein [Nannocystaceae bacterium]